MKDDRLIVDLFAGGGGASTGLEAATDRPVDVAINHSPVALAVHAANHPDTKHLTADVWEVDPKEATGGRPVWLLWASPDCFPAGTMILAREGYRPVEQIQPGDEVLTHLGRWRKVTATMSSVRPLVRLRGYGHPGLTVSTEHPIYARARGRRWNNEVRRYDRVLSGPEWRSAEDVGDGDYWATPISFPVDQPPAVPIIGERGTSITPELMWLAGRYVADGWTRLTATRAELVITCGHHKAEAFREKTLAWHRSGARAGSDEMAWHERDTRTARQFSTNHRGLVTWLREQFGHGAAEKRLPGWALGMPLELRRALLDGYLSGDGHRAEICGRAVIGATTVSRALAFGLKALVGSLGKSVTVSLRKQQNNVIEGRLVNALPAWQVRWREEIADGHSQTIREEHLEWAPVRERVMLDEEAEVFNLSVEEDESYVAEGVVVHNCTHFSVAKGGKPRKQKIRSLAEVVVRWARQVQPEIIFLENVQEFAGWGPLDSEGHPIRARMGENFRRWRRKLERAGYVVDHRVLDASLYGAPTRRRRLFLVARRDGLPIRWPEPTHGGEKARALNTRLLPLHTAAECIDWSLPCPSIFERKRPLAEKTLWRIAQGIRRFVLENPRPFIVGVGGPAGAGAPQPADEPLGTVLGENHRAVVTPVVVGVGGRAGQSHPTPGDAPIGAVTAKNDRALVTPVLAPAERERMARDGGPIVPGGRLSWGASEQFLDHGLAPFAVEVNHGKKEVRGQQLGLPLSTVTATQRGTALVAPVIARTAHGDVDRNGKRRGQGAHDPAEPIQTVTGSNDFAVATAHMITIDQQRSGGAVTGADAPLPVIVAKNRNALVTAFLNKHFGGVVGVPFDGRPLDTVTAVDHHSVTTASLVQIGYGEAEGQRARVNSAEQPLGTVVGAKKHAVQAATLVKLRGECSGADPQEPMPTVSAQGNHVAEVRAFLTAWYGEDGSTGQEVLEPMRTITAKHRLGLVTVEGTEYQIVDIGLRMLEPHELKRAQFGRFAEGYDLSAAKTKAAQVKLLGNSVCPEIAEAVVRANIQREQTERSVA